MMRRAMKWLLGAVAPETGVGTRNDATRAAWVEAALAALPAGGRLLDAGAGEQRFKPHCRHLRYVSQDIAEYDGTGDAAGLQTGKWDFGRIDHVCDITAVPEPDGAFDAILCTEVFEHIPDPVPAVREFARLLRPGGELILTAPFCSLTHFAPYHYATGFSRYYYEHHLPAHGFDVLEVTPNGNFFESLAQELRRVPDVAGRYAGSGLGVRERVAARILLTAFGRLSERGAGSAELLSQGYHVRARRK